MNKKNTQLFTVFQKNKLFLSLFKLVRFSLQQPNDESILLQEERNDPS